MKSFAELVARLEAATDAGQRIDAMCAYWSAAPAADAAWALRLLAGRGIGRRLEPRALREATCRAAGIEPWLFDACLDASGDWAETAAHTLPPAARSIDRPLAYWLECALSAVKDAGPRANAEQALRWCAELDTPSRELLLRLLLGRWRRLASDTLLQRALSRHAGIDGRLLELRWPAWLHLRARPDASRWTALLRSEPACDAERVLPHPFAPVEMIDGDAAAIAARLGDASQWVVHEWWRRDAGCACWPAREGEGGAVPAAQAALAASGLPSGTVVEGEWAQAGGPAREIPRGAAPRWVFRITDVLELAGRDLRALPALQRVAAARELACSPPLLAGASQQVDDWSALGTRWATARSRGVDALRLMRRDAAYGMPRALFDWRTPAWRATVLLQSAEHVADADGQACIELGLALWNRRPADRAAMQRALAAAQTGERLAAASAQLVPIAKLRVAARPGGDDDDPLGAGWSDWLREATVQRFGPVRWLRAQRACEIAFDAAVLTPRRRSGIVLRGARFVRWCDAVDAAAVDDLPSLHERVGIDRS
jgi:DNA ligase-1